MFTDEVLRVKACYEPKYFYIHHLHGHMPGDAFSTGQLQIMSVQIFFYDMDIYDTGIWMFPNVMLDFSSILKVWWVN